MGVLCAVSDADAGRRAAAEVSAARAVQWTALVGAGGLSVADDPQRPAALARGPTTNKPLGTGGLL